MDEFVIPELSDSFPFPQADGSDPGLSNASTASSWSIDTEAHVYSMNQALWHEMPSYVHSSPTSPYQIPSTTETPADFPDEYFKINEERPQTGNRKKVTPAVLSRRRAQNRASQRAYRDRKDRRVKDLEEQLDAMSKKHEKLTEDHATLSAAHEALQKEAEKWKEEKCMKKESSRRSSSIVAVSPGSPLSDKDPTFTVRVMICKKCFGEASGVKCVESGHEE